MMIALRDYNAAVDFVDRNVAEGRGDKTACIDPSRNISDIRKTDIVVKDGVVYRSADLYRAFGIKPREA